VTARAPAGRGATGPGGGAAGDELAERPQRLVFGEVADTYEAVRPAYPDAVFDLVLGEGRRTVLEVGAGTGKATASLLARGARVDALEPSGAMARVLRDKFASAALAVFEVGIESLRPDAPAASAEPMGPRPPPGGYDAVFAAQAWHWVDPEQGTAAAHGVLRPDGALALCWNHPLAQAAEVRRVLDEVYAREAPELSEREPGRKGRDITDPASPRGRALVRWFDPVEVHVHPWSARYDAGSYTALLGTQSDHRMLAPGPRERLLAGVAEAVERLGGIEVTYECRLVLGRPRAVPRAVEVT
jgi:SAM-dependent methyltransferase